MFWIIYQFLAFVELAKRSSAKKTSFSFRKFLDESEKKRDKIEFLSIFSKLSMNLLNKNVNSLFLHEIISNFTVCHKIHFFLNSAFFLFLTNLLLFFNKFGCVLQNLWLFYKFLIKIDLFALEDFSEKLNFIEKEL